MHIPWGLADQVVPVREPFDFKLWKRKSEEALPVYDLPSSGYPDERWESIVLKDYYQVCGCLCPGFLRMVPSCL